jgi:hypothetical protein
MLWCLNRRHGLFKVAAQLDVLFENMSPRHVLYVDETVLRVANLGNDVPLGDPARL